MATPTLLCDWGVMSRTTPSPVRSRQLRFLALTQERGALALGQVLKKSVGRFLLEDDTPIRVVEGLPEPPNRDLTYTRSARASTSPRSICFCVVWGCISSSSSIRVAKGAVGDSGFKVTASLFSGQLRR